MFQFITDSFFHTTLMFYMIPFALVGIRKDQKSIRWSLFLPFGLIAFSLLYLAYKNRGTIEFSILSAYFGSYFEKWNWNEAFRHIPLNNGWIFRIWQPHWLTSYMSFVYTSAFYMNLWVGVFRGFFAKDVKKMVRYMMAGLVIQMVVIAPFYHAVLLQEVWFVQGDPDYLNRHFSTREALLGVVKDCFPSMHTSTAFAVFLLAIREKSSWFKWLMAIDCISIILATQYLKIHWLIDVFAGIAVAVAAVKFVDWVLDRAVPLIWKRVERKIG